MKTRSIKTWDEEERPREKLMQQGAASLTNTELLAILLRSGTAEKSAIDLARDVMAISGGRLDALAREEAACLKAIHGIGAAKATAILACFELARRLAAEIPEDELTVRTSLVVARMMGPRLHDLPHEECWALFLNRANVVTGKEKLTSGTVDCTLIDSKQVVRRALDEQAKAVILVHNHPSGSPLPGESDLRATRQSQLALKTFDIQLFDHVILADGAYYSFQDERVCKSE